MNLDKLLEQLYIFNIKSIFITQIKYDINGQRILFFLNEELKNFQKKII